MDDKVLQARIEHQHQSKMNQAIYLLRHISRFHLPAFACLLISFFISIQIINAQSMVDPRYDQVYKTVEINGRLWMAENLRSPYKPRMFYTWYEAQEACPYGWRLPTGEEWKEFRDSFGNWRNAYPALIDGGHSGFNATLDGYIKRSDEPVVNQLSEWPPGFYGMYWSSSKDESYTNRFGYHENSLALIFDADTDRNNPSVRVKGIYQLSKLSCRCVKD